ncbi:MAG: serine--tRNA ligase, partial [Gemmatimonadetes bacterium]|nr:serine--tRNA ligase [Gemmatimonadota bacterium]
MIDIRRLREETDAVRAALAKRADASLDAQLDRVLELDVVRRSAISEVQELKATRNQVSKQVGELKRAGEPADALVAEMKEVGDRIDRLDADVRAAETEIEAILLAVPNLPLTDVQTGGEEDAEVIRTWGEPVLFDFPARPHWELGEALGLLDLARGSRISGSGFPVLTGMGARLQRVLIDFMLDLHTREHGYVELRVPYLVTRQSLTATGQLPKFAEESYLTERDDLWLIPTAEVPVTNMHRDELLSEADLPIRYTAYSPCFRREAGAAGKDTRGLLRVHQFDKV